MKKLGDLLSLGLIGISFYIFSRITGILSEVGYWSGLIGSIVTLVVEISFFLERRKR